MDGSALKGTDYPSRGCCFDSQSLSGASQASGIVVPWDLMASSGIRHTVHQHTSMQNNHTLNTDNSKDIIFHLTVSTQFSHIINKVSWEPLQHMLEIWLSWSYPGLCWCIKDALNSSVQWSFCVQKTLFYSSLLQTQFLNNHERSSCILQRMSYEW